MALTDKLTAIGDAIREKTETTELIPLGDMPGKVDDVYEAGRKAEYDKFWDSFQQNGNRNYYLRGFTGYSFDKDNFYPKYDMILGKTGQTQMFYNWRQQVGVNSGFNLKQRLEECGVVLDTSKATGLQAAFSWSCFGTLPTIDLSGCSDGTNSTADLFYQNGSPLKTIEKIIIHEGIIPNYWFDGDTGLENLTFEGTIGQSGLNVSPCPLTHDSLMSIINALKTFTDGTTKTVTLGATNIAKLTDAEKAIATQKGWTLA